MAPYTAESARPTQSKPNRPIPIIPRIVPAVPLALSRAPRSSRPITPEDNGPIGAAQDVPEVHQPTDQIPAEEHNLTEGYDPLTPDSKASVLSRGEHGDKTPESSSVGVSDAIVETEDTRDDSISDPSCELADEVAPQSQQETVPEPTNRPSTCLYPPEKPPTPTSATSSSIPSFQPPNTVTMHHPRPIANSIVFGGYPDSSNSSPAPPAGMIAYPPPPPPGFMTGNFGPPPFFAPGHSHHMSDPNGHTLYSPMVMPPPSAFGFRRDHPPPLVGQSQQWYPSGAHIPYQVPHPEVFPPRRGLGYVNESAQGSRSPSQASAKTQDGDAKLSTGDHVSGAVSATRPEPVCDFRVPQLQNGSLPPPVTSVSPDDSVVELANHLSSQFGKREFTDYILEVSHADAGIIFSMPVHSVIVTRSPTLASAIVASNTMLIEEALKVVRVSSRDKFINGLAFTEALKYLYGGALLTFVDLVEGLQPFDNSLEDVGPFSVPRQRMDQALSYAAAGFFLQLPNITARGIENAKRLLRWDTVEHALAFALDGGMNPFWGEFGERRQSISSAGNSPHPGSAHFTSPTYESYSTSLLRDVIEFIAYSFPIRFSLNTAVYQLSDNPLLPSLVDPRPPTHNPRLNKIQFGDVPIQDASRPSFVTNLLSSILLSLPFHVLQSLFAHHGLGGRLGWPAVVDIMQAVIEERENRRKKALKSYSKAGGPPGSDNRPLESLFWEERVELSSQYGSGFYLVRSRKGSAASLTENGDLVTS